MIESRFELEFEYLAFLKVSVLSEKYLARAWWHRMGGSPLPQEDPSFWKTLRRLRKPWKGLWETEKSCWGCMDFPRLIYWDQQSSASMTVVVNIYIKFVPMTGTPIDIANLLTGVREAPPRIRDIILGVFEIKRFFQILKTGCNFRHAWHENF